MSYEMVKLGDVGKIVSGATPKTNNNLYWNGDIPWITPAELIKGYNDYKYDTQRKLTKEGFSSSNLNMLPKDSILLTSRAPIGKVAIAGTSMCTNQGFKSIITEKEKIITRYLYHYLITQYEQLNNLGRGATFKEISKKIVEEFQIPLPPLETQKKIVEILDKAQSLIDQRKEQIKEMDSLVQSLFYDMFGDPVSNPKGWEVRKLAGLCLKITDGTHHSPKNTENGVPYISAKHLKVTGLDFYRAPVFISQESHNEIYSRCNPEMGDVLYIKDGATTGIAGINLYDFQFSMLSSLALLKVDSTKLNNYFLVHFLNNPRSKEHLIQGMAGGAIKRLTLNKINNFNLPLPPISLQKTFADRVKHIEQQKATMTTSLKELEDNFNCLMQRAFRGELV